MTKRNEDEIFEDYPDKNLARQTWDYKLEGMSNSEVIRALQDSGINTPDAIAVVNFIAEKISEEKEKAILTPRAILRAILVSMGSALLAGLLWGAILMALNFESSYMALAVGAICGYSVLKYANKKGWAIQLIAAAGALVGIVLGKYVWFYSILRENLGPRIGGVPIQILSIDVFKYFFESLDMFVNVYDLLWIVIAVVIAWSIPISRGSKLQGVLE